MATRNFCDVCDEQMSDDEYEAGEIDLCSPNTWPEFSDVTHDMVCRSCMRAVYALLQTRATRVMPPDPSCDSSTAGTKQETASTAVSFAQK